MRNSIIRVVHYGLGPIGVGVARLVARRADMRIVGAIDIDPAKAGRDIDVLLQTGHPFGVKISNDAAAILRKTRADIVVLATASSLKRVMPQIQQIAETGRNVISTCEELSYPAANNDGLVNRLNALARKHGVRIYGTGVNPGFAMDALPLMLTAPCVQVRKIRVDRVVDAGRRRLPLQLKVGAGLSRQQFQKRVDDGSVRHRGLRESATMIAASLGWRMSAWHEQVEAVMARRTVATPFLTVRRGQVAGVHQVGRGFVGRREVVTLDLSMYVGAAHPHDSVWVEGEPDVHMTIPGGLHGDVATAAIVVNSIPRVLAVTPGLWTPNDLPMPHWRDDGRA